MLLSTHKRIAKMIATELKMSPKEADYLEKGSIVPDYWKDYPHHRGKEHQIRKRICEARRLFLNNGKLESLFSLGVALHYVQDSWVSVSSSSVDHAWWEGQIDDAPFVNGIVEVINEFHPARIYRHDLIPDFDAQDVEKQFLQINEWLLDFDQLCRADFKDNDGRFAEELTLDIATLERPTLGLPIYDFNFAYRVSLMLALSVYTSKTSPTLKEGLKRIRKEFELKLRDEEKSLARRLIELSSKRDELEKKSGFVNRLKKMICNFGIWTSRRRYENRSHLLQIQKTYYKEAERMSNAYRNWYNVIIPELDIEHVERLLTQYAKDS